MSDAWERAKGESAKAYAAFCVYRDLGSERSLRKMANEGECGANVGQLERWSSRWKWVNRAAAYDDELDRQTRRVNEKERKQMVIRHTRISMLAQDTITDQLEKLLADVQADPKKRLMPTELARLMHEAVAIERLSRGEPTEIGKTEHAVAGLDETLRKIDEIYGLKPLGSQSSKPAA
jgi:hypothetical protein